MSSRNAPYPFYLSDAGQPIWVLILASKGPNIILITKIKQKINTNTTHVRLDSRYQTPISRTKTTRQDVVN